MDVFSQSRDDALNSDIQLTNKLSALEDEVKQPGATTKDKRAHQDHSLAKKRESLNQRMDSLQMILVRSYQMRRYKHNKKINNNESRIRHQNGMTNQNDLT